MKKMIQIRRIPLNYPIFSSIFEMLNFDNGRIKSKKRIEDSQYSNDIKDLNNYYSTCEFHRIRIEPSNGPSN